MPLGNYSTPTPAWNNGKPTIPFKPASPTSAPQPQSAGVTPTRPGQAPGPAAPVGTPPAGYQWDPVQNKYVPVGSSASTGAEDLARRRAAEDLAAQNAAEDRLRQQQQQDYERQQQQLRDRQAQTYGGGSADFMKSAYEQDIARQARERAGQEQDYGRRQQGAADTQASQRQGYQDDLARQAREKALADQDYARRQQQAAQSAGTQRQGYEDSLAQQAREKEQQRYAAGRTDADAARIREDMLRGQQREQLLTDEARKRQQALEDEARHRQQQLADESRLLAGTGDYGGSGGGYGGGAAPPPFPDIQFQMPTLETPADTSAANAAEFSRAKDTVGQTSRASLDALRDAFAARGLTGSGLEAAEMAGAVESGAGQLAGVSNSQAINDLAAQRDVQNRNFQARMTAAQANQQAALEARRQAMEWASQQQQNDLARRRLSIDALARLRGGTAY